MEERDAEITSTSQARIGRFNPIDTKSNIYAPSPSISHNVCFLEFSYFMNSHIYEYHFQEDIWSLS